MKGPDWYKIQPARTVVKIYRSTQDQYLFSMGQMFFVLKQQRNPEIEVFIMLPDNKFLVIAGEYPEQTYSFVFFPFELCYQFLPVLEGRSF